MLQTHGNDYRRCVLWRMKTYVTPILKYYVCRVAIGVERVQQRSRTPSGSPLHSLPVPCHPTHSFLDNLYSAFLSHVKRDSCFLLSLFLLHFSEICLSSILPRNLTERGWRVDSKNDTLKGKTIAAGTMYRETLGLFSLFFY